MLGRERLLVTLLKVTCISTLRREVLAGDCVTAVLATKGLFLVLRKKRCDSFPKHVFQDHGSHRCRCLRLGAGLSYPIEYLLRKTSAL